MPYFSPNQVELWNWWTLPQAVKYVVELDTVEPEEARRQIHSALIDGALYLKWGTSGPHPHLSIPGQEPEPPVGGPLWETTDFDWEAGTVLDNFAPTSGKQERRVLLIWRRALVSAFDHKERAPPPPPIQPLSGARASAVDDTDARSEPSRTGQPEPKGHIYRTGLAGKPTSWSLAAQECRRLYAAGERYPTAEWARMLRRWLETEHPAAPPLGQKSLTNNLAVLLRELNRSADTRPI